MQLRHEGQDLELEPRALERQLRSPGGRILLLIHGLCRNDLQWRRQGHDHGAALARDLGLTPVYLRYNTGRHVSTNGRALAGRLEALCAAWPVPASRRSPILAHSMGGLVARSACHYGAAAGHAWPRRLSNARLPRHAPPRRRRSSAAATAFETALEVSPYSAALGRLGKLRSAGITDLRHGNLLDDDWRGRRPLRARGDTAAAAAAARRRRVPLPRGEPRPQGGDLEGGLLGDGIVPVASALGRHDDPAARSRGCRTGAAGSPGSRTTSTCSARPRSTGRSARAWPAATP